MASWILVEPTTSIVELTGLRAARLPVRVERLDAVLGRGGEGDGTVDLVALVDELDEFIAEQPEATGRLLPSMVRLAIGGCDEALASGDDARAERVVRLARRWAPENVALRIRHGQALHRLGRHAEATRQWTLAVDRARDLGDWSPLLWLLTARSAMEQGDDASAAALLDEVCVGAPDDAVRRLRDRVARRTAQGGDR